MPIGASAIHAAIDQMDAKITGVDDAARQRLTETAELDQSDWFTFGDWPTRLHMAGIVNLEAANLLHAIHTAYSTSATLAERMVFLHVMGEAAPLFQAGRA